MDIKDRLTNGWVRVTAILDRIGMMSLWALLSLLMLIVIVAFFNPAKLGSFVWIISKLSLAAVLGYGFDLAASPGAAPKKLEGIEAAMAQTRRATLMAAAIIAAGLMP